MTSPVAPSAAGYTSAATVMIPPRESRPGVLPLLVALAVFAAHAALFGGWIVDDAGITFAYARNLAAGHGLVSQPGVPPVEGYSNPSWMLVAAAAYALRLFVLPWTPKILAALCVAGAFVVIWRDLGRREAGPWITGVALGLLAANSSFVIWTMSGLENALLAWLAALAASTAVSAVEGPEQPRRDLAAGAIAALLALTRPDAVLYAAGYPFALAVAAARQRPVGVGAWLRGTLRHAGGFLPVFGGYLLFRFLYFGDWVPNTFHAKVKPAGSSLVDPGKLLDLVEAAAGDFFVPLLLAGAAGTLYVLWRGARGRTIVLGAHLAMAIAIYMLMPLDWMGEYRFATPVFLFFFWYGAELTAALAERLPAVPALRPVTAVIAVVFVLQAATIFLARSLRFAGDPTVPLTVASRFGGEGFNRLAAALPDRQASLLTPDLGGVLLHSDLRVYDLAGLCDPVIARALHENPQRVRDYVLGEVRPTFVHTQGAFTRATALHEDPRFAQDYLPLHEQASASRDWVRAWPAGAAPPFWGDYVRRDAVRAPEALASLQETYRREGLAGYHPWVRPADRLRAGWPQVGWALRQLSSGGLTPALVPAAPAP
jgi:hypothetical protein